MAKPCPYYGQAIYADCLECDDKLCKHEYRYSRAAIGIDESYRRCGISIAADGRLAKVRSIDLSKLPDKRSKRAEVSRTVELAIASCKRAAKEVDIIVERVRLHSGGGMNVGYMTSTGALIAAISDTAAAHAITTYSVDTRCWKAQVVGTTRREQNIYGVPEEKWPTVKWCIANGFEQSIKRRITGRKVKGTFIDSDNIRYEYDNDAADSAAIAMFAFVGDPERLHIEQ